jgi:hypothetical protein
LGWRRHDSGGFLGRDRGRRLGRDGEGGELGGDGGNLGGELRFLRCVVVPETVAAEDQEDAQKDDGAGGDCTVWHGGEEGELGFRDEAGAFGAETAQDFVAVEAQGLGVGADEAGLVGGARQRRKLAALDGFEIGQADAQFGGDVGEAPAEAFADVAHFMADAGGA